MVAPVTVFGAHRNGGGAPYQHASHKPVDQAGASLVRRQSKIVQMQADANVEVLNQKALDVLQRVHDKLTGMDFAVTRKEAQADAPQGGRPQSNSLSKVH